MYLERLLERTDLDVNVAVFNLRSKTEDSWRNAKSLFVETVKEDLSTGAVSIVTIRNNSFETLASGLVENVIIEVSNSPTLASAVVDSLTIQNGVLVIYVDIEEYSRR
jgi:hypothetical protein